MPQKGQFKPKERVWDFVARTATCWLWTGYKDFKGYGIIHAGGRYRAHRLVWELVNGQIPENLFVLHRCDNPSCVNPDHLFLGTNQENTADSMRKGRRYSKLSWDSVRAMRKDRAAGATQVDLASKYGVSPTHVTLILTNKAWRE